MFSILSDRNIVVEPLLLDRDWPEVDRLLAQEEWPFVRADIEVSHAQPNAAAFVARQGNRLHGFFAAHHFGDVGYLDMMIVDAESRVSTIARRLYFATINEMKRRGMTSWVVHSTNDSYRMFQFLRFKRGQTFTLLARDPIGDMETNVEDCGGSVRELGDEDREAVVTLDACVFGLRREHWFRALARQSSARLFGLLENGELTASLCLRERKGEAFCLDAANAMGFASLQSLVDAVLQAEAGRRIECFARTDSPLHRHLLTRGFFTPEFFIPIGPLVEWRKGNVGPVGDSEHVQCLAWF